MKSRKIFIYNFIFVLIIGLSAFKSNAQGGNEINNSNNKLIFDPAMVSVPTPQAASLGRYGRVPVDLFNGLVSIDIPIYKLPVKGQDINIHLSYHSGGAKPNEKGGVVGTGWSLIAGGSITRVQNGTTDEYVNLSYTDSLIGYYWNRSQLNKPNWDSPDTMLDFLKNLTCLGLPSGTQGCPANPKWHDWAPDEFLFNFLGYSGSFWLDNSGNWQVRENSGEKLTVSVNMATYNYKYDSATTGVVLKYCFQNFRMTDGYGNVFVFGNDANSIELNRNSLTAILPSTASSWYLTQIITNKGEKVNFTYQRLTHSYSVYGSLNAYQAQLGGNTYAQYCLQSLSGVIHDPVYLKAITYNKLSVQFTYSKSNIFYYSSSTTLNAYGVPSTDPTVSSYMASPMAATLPSQELNPPKPTDYKLDKITVTYGNYSRPFSFAYYDSTVANRLFLKTVNIGPITRPLIYQFTYNGTRFSNYGDGKIEDGILTTKIDHWGYYTGKFPYKTIDLPTTNGTYWSCFDTSTSKGFPNDDFISNYYTNRQPNVDSMKVGALTKITYPTGGYTNLIYEPHDYSSQIDSTNYHSTFLNSNTMAGGLRVKEIDSYSDPYSLPEIKKYVYKNDNGYSSGVLNSSGILYKDSANAQSATYGTFILKYFYDHNLLPLQNSSGNHVTYSRVDEINADSSKTVYRYFNHDNGHYDLKPPYFVSATTSAAYYMRPNSRNFQRGKLQIQAQYDSSMNIVSGDTLSYINDDSLTTNLIGIRSYVFNARDIKMMSFTTSAVNTFHAAYIWTPSVSPFVYYKHFYPNIKKASTYYQNPDSLKTIETFTYNTNNNKLSIDSLTNLSDGSVKISTMKYPSDFSGNSFYTGMINQNVIDPVITSTKTNQNGKILIGTKDSLQLYTTNNGSFYRTFEKDQYQVLTDLVRTKILKYDSVGNPVNVIGPDSIPMCYLWNYSSIYPVAIIKNADSTSVAYTSFEGEGNGYWSLPDTNYVTSKSLTGLQSYVLNNTKIITRTVPSGKQYIVSYWTRNGAAVVQANGTGVSTNFTGLTKSGWKYYEHLLPNTTTAINVTASATDTLDELRLYPVNAQMTSYTYSPISGVTYACSPANTFVHYEWDDGLGRLDRIRDMDNNIIKQFEYKYQMVATPFYNVLKSGQFTRSNCDTSLQGSTVTYTVPAGTYNSNLSQGNADTLAINDVNANGQHYADSIGVCGVKVRGFDDTGVGGFIAAFTSLSGQVYSFTIDNSNGGLLGFIPKGRYSLTISKPGNTTNYSFTAGCSSLTTTGTSATFGLIQVNISNCGLQWIYVDPL